MSYEHEPGEPRWSDRIRESLPIRLPGASSDFPAACWELVWQAEDSARSAQDCLDCDNLPAAATFIDEVMESVARAMRLKATLDARKQGRADNFHECLIGTGSDEHTEADRLELTAAEEERGWLEDRLADALVRLEETYNGIADAMPFLLAGRD